MHPRRGTSTRHMPNFADLVSIRGQFKQGGKIGVLVFLKIKIFDWFWNPGL